MSGPIRQKIGLSKNRLKGYLANLVDFEPREDEFDSDTENINALVLLKGKITHEKDKIVKSIKSLEELDNSWTYYIQKLPTKTSRDEEEAVYTDFLEREKTSDTENFLEVLERARKTLDNFDTKIFESQQMIDKLRNGNGKNAKKVQKMRSRSTSSSNSSSLSEIAKLPKLELKPFYGQITDWQRFWDSFTTLVDKQKHLNEVVKFNYLVSYLRGRAASAISGLPITAQNYKKAKETIMRRFSNKKILKSTLYTELQKITIATDQVSSLRATFESIESVLFQLEEVNEDLTHPSLMMMLETKYPKNVYEKIQKAKNKDPVWDLDKFREFLDSYISSKEEVNKIYGKLTQKSEKRENKTDQNFSNSESDTSFSVENS